MHIPIIRILVRYLGVKKPQIGHRNIGIVKPGEGKLWDDSIVTFQSSSKDGKGTFPRDGVTAQGGINSK